MKKIIVNIVNKTLSILFPYKEPDKRPDYDFGEESWLTSNFRTGNIDKYRTFKL